VSNVNCQLETSKSTTATIITTHDTKSRRRQTPIRSGSNEPASIMTRLYTADEMLQMGLGQIGFSDDQQERVKRATNVRRFKAHYGSSPLVLATIWEDLMTTDILAARIPSKTSPEKLFLGMYFLKEYPTEEHLAGFFSKCEKGARKWVWSFVRKIQALKAQKVRNLRELNVSALLKEVLMDCCICFRLYGQRSGPMNMPTTKPCQYYCTLSMAFIVVPMKQLIRRLQRTLSFTLTSLIKLDLDMSLQSHCSIMHWYGSMGPFWVPNMMSPSFVRTEV
jgi:hypothetical protein